MYHLIYYILGGIDRYIGTLFLLQILHSICLCLDRKGVPIVSMLKVYIVIATSVIADNLLNLDIANMRIYLLLYYSYNEIVDILNILKSDKNLSIPKKLLDKLNKKRGE